MEKNKQTIVDQKERDQIINDIDKNIFVEAGAGSGKTASLVSRMVTMIKKGIPVNEISAITFTKAAAVEFYNRIEKLLSEAISSNIPQNEKELCEVALLNIDSCFMGTIDSFCNMILSENPIEANIPLNSTIVEEEEYEFLLGDEYNHLLQNIDKKDKPLLDAFLRFQYYPKDVFVECLKTLLEKRNYSIDTKNIKDIEKEEQDFYDKYKKELRILVKNIIADDYIYLDEGETNAKKAKEYLKDNSWVINEKWEERPSLIVGLLKNGLCKARLTSSFKNITSNFDDYYEKAPKGQFYKPKNKYKEILKEYETIQYDYTLAFISRSLEIVSSNLISKGKLSFFDNLLLFRNLLKNDAKNGGELIKRINKKHKYYLVDEFQDTDPLQSEIVFYLTAENINEDFKLCKPAKGTLFIVGDPKQSIYRFRNADVESYNKIKDLFEANGDLVLKLTSNFRTHKKLINYFNSDFDSLFNSHLDSLQAKFDSVDYVAYSKKRKDAIIEGIYEYEPQKGEDPKCVSNIINNLVKKGYKYSDFMVLTYRKTRLVDYMNSFDENIIPYEIVGQSIFDQCEPLTKLISIFGVFAYPSNSFYIYKVLKNVFKMADSSIYSIYKGEKININNTYNNELIDKLVSFYHTYNKEDIIYVFNKILEEFDLFRKSSVKHLEYLYYAKEILRNEIASRNVVTFIDAYKSLNDLIEKKSIEKCLSLSNDFEEDRVLLANVHKVKGLERRIVILTNYTNIKSRDEENKINIHSSFKDNKNYIIRVNNPNYHNTYYIETDQYINETNTEAEALEYEKERIAYVAATRACDALFVSSNSLNKDGKNAAPWGYLLKNNNDEIIRNKDYTDDCTKIDRTPIKVDSLSNDVISFNDPKYLDSTYSIVSPSKLINLTDDESHLKGKTINNDAALKGTLIHRLMELYVSCNFKDDIDTYLNMINNEFDVNHEYDDALKKVYNTINNGGFNQDNGFDKDIISILKQADEIYSELPFSYNENNNIYNGIIDLLYKKDNKWVIVDYKTNFDSKELDKKYENQLEAYKKALLLQDIEAEAYIYHIDAI